MTLMSGLFLSFDPFIFSFSILALLSLCWWLIPSVWLHKAFLGLRSQLAVSKETGSSKLLAWLGCWLLIVNLGGLLPWVWGPTSQPSCSLVLALCMWMTTFSMSLGSFTRSTIGHLTPAGTPGALLSVMVSIETVSQLIRPLTLGVRLTANITAGHLLLSLIAESGAAGNVSMVFLMLLETLVAVVQAGVFVLLLSLYCTEV